MKIAYKFSICFFILLLLANFLPVQKVFAEEKQEQTPMLAIVIDDFGQARAGVKEMLDTHCTLTCAVMPGLDYSVKDAETAHKKGHEVILHMPMEAYGKLPDSWYGPKVIRNYDKPERAKELIKECIDATPHCVGVNIHIGSGVCLNKELMTAIMEEVRDNGKYFLDSKTHEKSVCTEVAAATNEDFLSRDFFLELTGNPDYEHAKSELLKAAKLAKKRGYAVAIGHVGPEGGVSTANAISDCLETIEEMGVEIVPLSKIVERNKN